MLSELCVHEWSERLGDGVELRDGRWRDRWPELLRATSSAEEAFVRALELGVQRVRRGVDEALP